MKKQRNYAWLAVLFVFVMAAVPSVLPSILKAADKKANEGPCPYDLCQGSGSYPSGETGCTYCARSNGYCDWHQKQAPKKPTE